MRCFEPFNFNIILIIFELTLGDRLVVGLRSLKAATMVRIHVSQPIFKRKNRVEMSTFSTYIFIEISSDFE